MRHGDTRIFTFDHELLLHVLQLRSEGLSYHQICLEIDRPEIDRTSIIYQCKKYNVEPYRALPEVLELGSTYLKRSYSTKDIKKPSKFKKVLLERDEPTNPGMSYKEYLLQQARRGKSLNVKRFVSIKPQNELNT